MNAVLTPTLIRILRTSAWAGATLAGAAAIATMSTCSPGQSVLSQVKALGVLRVATVNSPTTYYVGPGGPTGFEYDLVKGFADHLGVELELMLAATPPEALEMARTHKAHLAAAGIGISEQRRQFMRFTQPLLTVVPQLVYRQKQPKPKDLGDLSGRLRVVAGTVHAERLRELKATTYPDLEWEESTEEEAEELLYKVANDELDYTIANSDVVAINQRYYPQLRVAFALSDAQDLAWALPLDTDASLHEEATVFLAAVGGPELARLRDRYFGHVEQVDYIGAVTLATHVETRLPRYRKAFEEAAAKYDLDWRLVAAMGYQESHWDPSAVSPTGVRGIMQLTLGTAALLNVSNREDPIQSIWGGARYFRQLLERIPPEVTEPDRTWMALAAYNIGLGHVFDAQMLTEQQGGDPNRWLDVRNVLPLLTQSRWHRKTRHGYARGYEAMTYVGNIRTYYDMLVWITGGPTPKEEAPTEAPPPKPPEENERDPLKINSPVL